jgi:THO complex subunit 1
MAVQVASELEMVSQVTARLGSLLARATTVKPESSVEPPLPTASFADDIEALHDDFPEHYDQQFKFITVETAARELFYSIITSTHINDAAFVQVWNLLDIVLICGDHGKCDAALICLLLEELLDSQTTDGCRTVFDYLDSRRDRLAQKDFHKKNLIFLRSCNELLRRLSRAEDAIFCGRVFFFLFQTFPLGDKSSVNLRGEFHVENTTKFDESETATADGSAEQMEIDSQPEEQPSKESTPQPAAPTKPGSKAVPIKAPPRKAPEEEPLPATELYPLFWRLQHDFSDPTRLFDTPNFAAFKKGLASTIVKFKKTPTVVQTKAGEEQKRGTKRKMDEDGTTDDSSDHLTDNYNPKYLTSKDLFDLELSDLAFQRHILVQALILIDFLLSLTDKAKKRLALLTTTNKSMLYSFTLNEEDTKWATSTRSTITSYLSSTAEGRQYCRMVETVLARDKNWVRWKVESCPSIVRGPVSTEQEMAARKGAAQATRPRKIPDRPMGAMDLGFLDEGSGGGLEALKKPSRYTAPTIEQLVDQVKTDKLDADFAADDEEKASFDNAIQNAKWRALRQARSSNLSLLNKVESTKDLEEMPIITAEELEAEAEAEAAAEQNGDDAGASSGEADTNARDGVAAVGDDETTTTTAVDATEEQKVVDKEVA